MGRGFDSDAVNGNEFIANLRAFSKGRACVVGADEHATSRFTEVYAQPGFPFLVAGVRYQFQAEGRQGALYVWKVALAYESVQIRTHGGSARRGFQRFTNVVVVHAGVLCFLSVDGKPTDEFRHEVASAEGVVVAPT